MSSWFTSTPESEAALAEERLVLSATEMVYEALEHTGHSKKFLAGKLGVSRSEVSQRLNGKRNLTLRTLAAMLHQLGMKAELSLKPADSLVGEPDYQHRSAPRSSITTTYTRRAPLTIVGGTAA